MAETSKKTFNLNKGSIPVRTTTPQDGFDYCAYQFAYDMEVSSSNGTLLPFYAHGMALRCAQAGAITDVVTTHFNSDMSSKDAVAQIFKAVKNSL